MAFRGKEKRDEAGSGRTTGTEGPTAAKDSAVGYVFDFGEQGPLRRPAKRHRAH